MRMGTLVVVITLAAACRTGPQPGSGSNGGSGGVGGSGGNAGSGGIGGAGGSGGAGGAPMHGNGAFDFVLFDGSCANYFRDLAAGDFDGNGTVDVAGFVANEKTQWPTVCSGRGDGHFDADGTFETPDCDQALIGGTGSGAADLDGDGHPEYLFASHVYCGGSVRSLSANRLRVDDSARQAQALTTLSVGDSLDIGPFGMAAADFDGDGHLDLALAAGSATVAVSQLLLGNGDGTMRDGGSLGSLSAALAGDLDGDDQADLLTVAATPGCGVSFVRGSGDGHFAAPLGLGVASCIPPLVLDLDGDGRLDFLVVTAQPTTRSPKIALTPYVSDGHGGFHAGPVVQRAIDVSSAGAPPTDTPLPVTWVSADFDGDGHADLALQVLTLALLRGDGHGGFTDAGWIPDIGFELAGSVADIDGDGRPDLVGHNGILLDRIPH